MPDAFRFEDLKFDTNLKFEQIFFSASGNEVRNLSIASRNQNLYEPFNATTTLTWILPCRSNGKFEKFAIDCSRTGFNESLSYEVFVTDNRDEYSFSTDDFVPDSIYIISIKTVTVSDADEKILGMEKTESFLIEAGRKDSWFSVDL